MVTLISVGCFQSCDSGASEERVNVVLISIDSLRADHVHSYGYRRRTTPGAISRLRRNEIWVSFRTDELKLLLRREGSLEIISLFDLKLDAAEKDPVLWRRQRAKSPRAEERFNELWNVLAEAGGHFREYRPVENGIESSLPEELKESLRSLGYIQ